ncbi:MAG: helix-turn-helix transcriptional regulator [Oscillospiraceae bacterium]|nr:helix-turn-helix transcriptional regulator [Oscillospiraceae bacterium]
MYDFGVLLRQLRKNKKMTQQQLADKLGMNKSNISRYEQNIQVPSHEVMVELAAIFNVSLDYLTGLSNKNAVSLNGLTESQTEIILGLSNMFREKKPMVFRGFTNQQLEMLNSIVREFSKTEQ